MEMKKLPRSVVEDVYRNTKTFNEANEELIKIKRKKPLKALNRQNGDESCKDKSKQDDDNSNENKAKTEKPDNVPKKKFEHKAKKESPKKKGKKDKNIDDDDFKEKKHSKNAKKTTNPSDSDSDFEVDLDRPKKKPKETRGNESKSKTKNSKKKLTGYLQETISFTSYIEIDMHGLDPNIKRALDWVPIIRDYLFSAIDQHVEIVSFIPGKGKHSYNKIPVLRPLVLLTSKRLGFDSFIDPKNEGVVICPISSYHKKKDKSKEEDNTDLLRSFGAFTSSININDYKDVITDDDDDDDDDDDPFKAVKKRFPKMPKICIELICANRKSAKDAVRYAKLFEEYLHKNAKKTKKTEDEKLRSTKLMKRIQKYEEKYKFDREIIERVVLGNPSKDKIEEIFERILREIPDEYYNDFVDLVSEYKNLGVESILDTSKEGDYDINKVFVLMSSKSVIGVTNALGVKNVDNNIKSNRADGLPKFLPSIEIDLTNAGPEKAIRSLRRIMDSLGTGTFSNIVLQFAKNPNNHFCKIEDVQRLVREKVNEKGLKFIQTNDRKNHRTHFIIKDQNPKEDIIEEDEEDVDDDDFIFSYSYYKNHKKI